MVRSLQAISYACLMKQLIRDLSKLSAICAPWFSLAEIRSQLEEMGVTEAVAVRDTPALFDWLVDVLSYQGVSDAIAERYIK